MSQTTQSKAKTTYPLYSATWASSKPSFLVVGGGGGAGRHGVKNQISVFDFSSREARVEPYAEIEASEHDSVACLANLGTKGGAVLYAGINDSEEERLKDRNEHLKAFEVRFPTSDGNTQAGNGPNNISFLSKTSLLAPPMSTGAKKEGYQRIVRLSPVRRTASNTPNKRIGAVASSLAGSENEIVIFSATSNKPENPRDVIHRIALHSQEANDMDILDQGNGKFQVAYCLDNDVYVQRIHYDFAKSRSLGKGDADRIHTYTVPFPDLNEKKGRSRIKCLRWLSPSHVLLVVNKPNKTGAELHVLRIYQGTSSAGSIILRQSFPRHVKAFVDMDVALLDADENGAYQAVVAVAAIDVSLTVLTIDVRGEKLESISRFNTFATYYNVHEQSITKVAFSPFFKPESSPGKKLGPQYLRLATTSFGNTIDVETFELYPASKKPQSHYVLQSARSRAIADTARYMVIAMIIAAIAFMLQGFIDPEGNVSKSIRPGSTHNALKDVKAGTVLENGRNVPILNNADSSVVKTTQRLRDLLHLHHHSSESAPDGQASKKALIVHHDPETDGKLSTEVHDGDHDVVKKHTDAKRWEELEEHEQHWWREKLVSAGIWTIEEGETILKGIFFGQAGALIGRVAAEALG